MSDYQTCQYCDRQAYYFCGDCKTTAYCSIQHRNQHWKVHKDQCKVIQRHNQHTQEGRANQRRQIYRKQYFENYSNKIYDDCLAIAIKLYQFEKIHLKQTKHIFNEFQYGISVTLLCRTYVILQKFQNAQICINQYTKEKLHFLQDLRDIPQLKDSKDTFNATSKQFFNKKLSLIASVANIYYTLKLSCINYYIIYAKHVQFAFGSESLEHSNCFFMMGSYYKEKKQYNKSIACFLRAANIRGSKGGDCYFNLGILYYLQKKPDVAIKMFQNSISLKREEDGEGTIQIAQIYQKIGVIYSQNNHFKSAIDSNQKALKIYSNKKQMHKYDQIRQKIKQLHSKFKQYLQIVDKQTLSKQIREAMGDAQLLKKMAKQNQDQSIPEERAFLQQKRKQASGKYFQYDKIFKLSENFLNRLNSIQIFRLSEMQLELQKCKSQYAVAYTIQKSQFLQKISPNRLNQMKNQNQKLFQLMNIQMKPIVSKEKKVQTQN